MKGLEFSNGVVIGFAFAVTEPSEEAKRDHDDADSDAEFRLFAHRPTPNHAVPNHEDSITAKNEDSGFNWAKGTCPSELRPEARFSARCRHSERFVQAADGTTHGSVVGTIQGECMARIQDEFAA